MRTAFCSVSVLALLAPLAAACAVDLPSPPPAPSVAVVAPAPAAVPVVLEPPPPPPPPVAATPPPPPPPPAGFQEAIAEAKQAIGAGDYAAADRQIALAAPLAGADPHLEFLVAYCRATRFEYSGDLEKAAAALVSAIPDLARHPETADEFWAHNAMMMVRESQGDAAAALAENDQATLAAERGTWQPDKRETLAYLKDRWHRAYLTRMLAQTRKGTARQALVRYAEMALDDYRERAHKLGSNDESIAVLEAYFAALDGDGVKAAQAARKVDPATDDDLEDLYLVVVGLAAGGDRAAADAVRQVIRKPGSVYLGHPIMKRWVDHDANGAKDPAFTPWHTR